MTFTIFTDNGGMPVNDDFADSREKNGIYCFAAADGMGKKGRAAAELAVGTILDEFEKVPNITEKSLMEYITQAQRKLLYKKTHEREYDTAATTIAVLITNGYEAIKATTGDTRIYTFKKNLILEVSDDHSEAFEEFLDGNLAYHEIRTYANRHVLRRAIGDGISWEPDISPVFKIDESNSFLICTDGFWNIVTEEEMEKTHLFAFSSKGWLRAMLKKAAKRLYGGSDNISAIAICM